MLKKLLLVVVVICFSGPAAHADTVTLAWDANTESNLAGYKLHYGNTPRSQGAYAHTVTIPGSDVTRYEVSLDPGTYYFALTAYNNLGNESGYSNEVWTEISPDIPGGEPPGKPGKPILVP